MHECWRKQPETCEDHDHGCINTYIESSVVVVFDATLPLSVQSCLSVYVFALFPLSEQQQQQPHRQE